MIISLINVSIKHPNNLIITIDRIDINKNFAQLIEIFYPINTDIEQYGMLLFLINNMIGTFFCISNLLCSRLILN